MDLIKNLENIIKLLEEGRAYFQEHIDEPERLKDFPINTQEEDVMAKDIIHRIRVMLHAIEEVGEDRGKKEILMNSLKNIYEMTSLNYKDFFDSIRAQTEHQPEIDPQKRAAIEESLGVLFPNTNQG